MAGPSLLWLRDNEPEIYADTGWALQPKDWLRLRLTKEVAAEPSDASATLLYDVPGDRWDYELAETLELRTDFLAPVIASSDVAGELTWDAAEHLGLRPGVPVSAGAADTAAAMLGTGLSKPGDVQLTVGTGAQIVAPIHRCEPDPNGRSHLYRAAVPDLFYSMAAIQNAGLALEWARSVLGASWDQVYEEAFAVPPGSDGVTFLPYLSGERTPHMDSAARGAWTGLGLGHERGHLLRAALEGVAFGLREAMETLEAVGTPATELRLAGGGSTKEPWRQLLADVLDRPLLLLPDDLSANASARGAALLAGLSTGVYTSFEEATELAPSPERPLHPGTEAQEYEESYAQYKELYSRLHR
jgi:xylulokinase